MRKVASATVGIFLLLIMLAPRDIASASSILSLYVPSGSCSQLGIFEGINVTVQSNVPYPVTEIIFGVFRNNIGQPLEVATSALIMNPYQNQTGFLIFNLPHGNYSTYVFVLTPEGIPISFTLSQVAVC